MNVGRLRSVFLVNLRLCMIEVFANRTRSFISSLGIFLGVASLLVNLAFVRAMEASVQKSMESAGGLNILTIEQTSPSTPKEAMEFQRSPGLSIAQARELVSMFSYVKDVLPEVDLRWDRLSSKGKRTYGRLKAVSSGYFDTYGYEIDVGRFFGQDDELRKNLVCVVGSRIAERLVDSPEKLVGQSMTVRGLSLQVVGVIKSTGGHDRRSMECFLPYSVYTMKLGRESDKVGEVAVLLEGAEYVDQARREITAAMRGLHRGITDFEIDASLDKIKEMKVASLGMKVILLCIAAISLLVGGVSIANIMFATIGERIREIGIRKALGAQRHDIFLQFIIEAVLVCLVGGAPGMILGGAVTLAPEGTFPFEPSLLGLDYVMAFGFIVVAGLFSGLFPALRAARMQPVEALRF